MSEKSGEPASKAGTGDLPRAEKLAAAMRDNLRKRNRQRRAHEEAKKSPDAGGRPAPPPKQ
ncbi:MAG: hypothetical protein ACFB6S_01975 [Geminicoccaceae bacterium]